MHGGVPQGSILGVLLFNITTDNLEDTERAVGYQEDWRPGNPTSSSSSCSPDNQLPMEQSTSISVERPDFELGITLFRCGGTAFLFLDNAINVRRAIGLDPDTTLLRDATIPHEPNPLTSPSAFYMEGQGRRCP